MQQEGQPSLKIHDRNSEHCNQQQQQQQQKASTSSMTVIDSKGMQENPTTNIKRKRRQKCKKIPLTLEQKLDSSIKVKNNLINQIEDLDDADYDLSNEQDFEQSIRAMNRRNECFIKVIEMETREREYVDFDDSEITNHLLADEFSIVRRPIFIYQTDLEPLNTMLTDFINHPGGFSAEYIIPTFDDIKSMLRQIRDSGDCKIYNTIVPRDCTVEFDAYVTKILGDLKHIVGLKRHQNFLNDFEENVASREAQLQSGEMQNNEKMDTQESFGIFSGVTFNDKLMAMEKMGEICKEEEPTMENVEDLENIDDEEVSIITPITEAAEEPTSSSFIGFCDNQPEVIELSDSDDKNDEICSLVSDLEVIFEEKEGNNDHKLPKPTQ